MEPQRIAVVGGTGPQGKGLAYRFARAGHTVVVGSRSPDRAAEAATEVEAHLGSGAVSGRDNVAACEAAGVVLLAVPYAGHADLVRSLCDCLDGKTVVSCVNPLGFDGSGPYGLEVPDGSAAEEAQNLVPGARVVGAFHHLSAVKLWSSEGPLDEEDVLVCGDHGEDNHLVADLSRSVNGRVGLEVGPLRLARQLEPLTALLINVNKRYRTRSGVHLTGVEVRERVRRMSVSYDGPG